MSQLCLLWAKVNSTYKELGLSMGKVFDPGVDPILSLKKQMLIKVAAFRTRIKTLCHLVLLVTFKLECS